MPSGAPEDELTDLYAQLTTLNRCSEIGSGTRSAFESSVDIAGSLEEAVAAEPALTADLEYTDDDGSL